MNLPGILDCYFNAQNAHDIDAMVDCFAPDAVVRDEGREYIGTEAIRAWKIDTSTRYHITAQPIESSVEGDRTVVIVRASGTFAGSPLRLSYRFGFSADRRIGALDVH